MERTTSATPGIQRQRLTKFSDLSHFTEAIYNAWKTHHNERLSPAQPRDTYEAFNGVWRKVNVLKQTNTAIGRIRLFTFSRIDYTTGDVERSKCPQGVRGVPHASSGSPPAGADLLLFRGVHHAPHDPFPVVVVHADGVRTPRGPDPRPLSRFGSGTGHEQSPSQFSATTGSLAGTRQTFRSHPTPAIRSSVPRTRYSSANNRGQVPERGAAIVDRWPARGTFTNTKGFRSCETAKAWRLTRDTSGESDG